MVKIYLSIIYNIQAPKYLLVMKPTIHGDKIEVSSQFASINQSLLTYCGEAATSLAHQQVFLTFWDNFERCAAIVDLCLKAKGYDSCTSRQATYLSPPLIWAAHLRVRLETPPTHLGPPINTCCLRVCNTNSQILNHGSQILFSVHTFEVFF